MWLHLPPRPRAKIRLERHNHVLGTIPAWKEGPRLGEVCEGYDTGAENGQKKRFYYVKWYHLLCFFGLLARARRNMNFVTPATSFENWSDLEEGTKEVILAAAAAQEARKKKKSNKTQGGKGHRQFDSEGP